MAETKTATQLFVQAWIDCKNPELDSTNPHFKNKYASLKATLEQVRSACVTHGIAYLQQMHKVDENRAELRSCVITKDGERLELSTFPVECPPNPQSFGSNLTYAKRQQAQADWGIVGEEDDDGNAAAEDAKTRPAQKKQPKPATDRKSQFLKKCLDLKTQCMQQGIKESGLDSWYQAQFGDTQPKDLSLENLTEWGKYLRQMADDSAQMIGDTDEH